MKTRQGPQGGGGGLAGLVFCRLTKAFEALQVNDQPERTAKAIRLRFKLRQILPQDDSLSVPLLRLMMAADDARHLEKSWIKDVEDMDEANDVEAAILRGEMTHLFRMLCGHLYEAGIAFRAVDQVQPDLLQAAVASDEEGKAALDYVRKAYAVDSEEALHFSFLKPIRDEVGFHYKQGSLNQALSKLINTPNLDAALTVCEAAGLSRYNITDHLTAMIIATQLNVGLEGLQEKLHEKMGGVIKLAGHLASVVDLLLLHLFEARPGAVLEQRDCTITIPPQVLQARGKVDKERNDQQAGGRRQP